MTTMSHPTTSCLQCDKPNASWLCSRCKLAAYCSKECQVSHWSVHKSICPATNTVSSVEELLKTLRICRISKILPASLTHNARSAQLVMDGTSKVSSSMLYTFSPATCVIIAIIGRKNVILQHLSGWNAPGNPYCKNERIFKKLLPADFEFVEGYVVPGFELDNNLVWGVTGSPVFKMLLWENLDSMEWKGNLKLLTGCTPGIIFEVSVKNGLRIFNALGGDKIRSFEFPMQY